MSVPAPVTLLSEKICTSQRATSRARSAEYPSVSLAPGSRENASRKVPKPAQDRRRIEARPPAHLAHSQAGCRHPLDGAHPLGPGQLLVMQVLHELDEEALAVIDDLDRAGHLASPSGTTPAPRPGDGPRRRWRRSRVRTRGSAPAADTAAGRRRRTPGRGAATERLPVHALEGDCEHPQTQRRE
jgi:hypothetical protein